MGINGIEAAIGLQQLHRRFGANTAHTGNIIGTIAAEGFVVNNLLGPDIELGKDRLPIHLFGLTGGCLVAATHV